MNSIVLSSGTLVWMLLSVLTVVSWVLGTDHGFGGAGHVPASLAVIAVAIFKIRLVGLYFMELRGAPPALRRTFEGYCLVLFGLLAGMFLYG